MGHVTRLSLFVLIYSASAFAVGTAKDNGKMQTFINRLMSKMTVEEKAGQLVQFSADMAITGAAIKDNYRADIKKGLVGSIFNAYTPQFTRELQRIAVEESRLKIPLLFGYDVIHGHRTVFPIPLAESCSWDLSAIEMSARVSAREAAADGLHWTFAPMVDIARDPRWGRILEGAGEDPWWGSQVAASRVKGFQGSNPRSTENVLACVKHFAAYGAPMAGRDYNLVDMSQRELFENYLPPYKAAVAAGAASVMTSFNEISGVPSTSNRWLLTDLLRKQWGFKGFVVTDYTSINELVKHGVAENEAEAGALALKAGVDMDMQGAVYQTNLARLLKEKRISLADLNAAVRRVLEAKYALGLFEDPYRFSDEKRAQAELMKPDNLKAARDVARRSIVLLKNANSVLPLRRSGRVALIGPFIDDRVDLLGAWNGAGDDDKAVTLHEGLKQIGGDKVEWLYAKGANLVDDKVLFEKLRGFTAKIEMDKKSPGELLREAVSTAKKADVIVLALGESKWLTGEAASRTQIRLPSNQTELLKALKATGKPIVLVLFNGRPLALEVENNLADALVEAWYLGHQSGLAVADVLFGDYNPSGKLTTSFPYNEGQIPIFYAEKSTGRPANPQDKYTSKYVDAPNEPLFPFGWGLSYTQFDYGDIQLSATKMGPRGQIQASVMVSNSGKVEGEEVVQLYIRDVVASVTRPLKQLRGAKKIALKPGQSQQVSFTVTAEDLKFYNQQMQWVIEPGLFHIMIGPNSSHLKSANLTVTKN